MDTRIGYPTEHLANNDHIENLTSPMYSTGIGLVLKGFQAIEKSIEQPLVDERIDLINNPKKGSFFESIFIRSKQFLTDED